MNNKVAVIMSVYKSDNYNFLVEAVQSILKQTYQDVTLFLYRDGPVSNCVDEYLEEVQESNGNVVLHKAEENAGLATALNQLIEFVVLDGGYEFIARMDSDDLSRPERIERQVCFLSENPGVDICGTSCREFGASFSLSEKHLPKAHNELLDFSIAYCPLIHPTVMFRSSVFESGVRYPVDTVLTEDMALWFELLRNGYVFGNINDVLLDYRLDEGTIERRSGFKKGLNEYKIRIRYMFLLKRFSAKNLALVSSRLLFHIMPPLLIKLAYKYLR